jgi:hypothetical protein
MRKYFDAFLYYANWGTHRLMLRLPSGALDVKTAKRYLGARSVSAHRKDNIVILDFGADDDSGNWTEDCDGSGLLSSLIARSRCGPISWLATIAHCTWGGCRPP